MNFIKFIKFSFCVLLLILSVILTINSILLLNKNTNVDEKTHSFYKKKNVLTSVFIDDKMINVGELSSDTLISRNYIMKNIGIDTLYIYSVNPDCNCTGYSLSSNFALPGDSIIINIAVDTRKKKKGRFMLNTVVEANTDKRFYKLRLSGTVLHKK